MAEIEQGAPVSRSSSATAAAMISQPAPRAPAPRLAGESFHVLFQPREQRRSRMRPCDRFAMPGEFRGGAIRRYLRAPARLVERADHVLASWVIDAGLAASGRVHRASSGVVGTWIKGTRMGRGGKAGRSPTPPRGDERGLAVAAAEQRVVDAVGWNPCGARRPEHDAYTHPAAARLAAICCRYKAQPVVLVTMASLGQFRVKQDQPGAGSKFSPMWMA
jgi:hypothetical protein